MKRNYESGVTILLVALGLTMLLGAVGLGVDMGYLRYERRLQQGAADAAAIAGASDLATNFGGHTGALAAAVTAATANGYAVASTSSGCPAPTPTGAVGTIVLTVNNPPCSGPNQTTDYVEVYVGVVQPTFFMRVFGTTSEPVVTRAVATNVGGGKGSGCLYTLGNPNSSIEGVNVNGNVTVSASTCGVVDNGNFDTKGAALTFNTGTFGIAGDWNKKGPGGIVTCAGSPTQCPTTTNMPPAGDPLAGQIAPPAQPAASVSCPSTGACNVTTSGTQTLQPGTYSSITMGSNSVVDFAPGIYYINGSSGLTFNGTPTICNSVNADCSGMPGSANSGVTFYFTGSATIGGTGTPTIQLAAPNDGTYAGILFYQNPADTNTTGPSLGGTTSSFFQGALYFPSDQLTFFGTASFNSGAAYTIVIADALSFSGTPDVTLKSDYTKLPGGGSIIKNAVLVE